MNKVKSKLVRSGLVLMSSIALGSVIAPSSLAFASEEEQPSQANVVLNNTSDSLNITSLDSISDNVKVTYLDEFGNEHEYNPYARFTSSVIYVGIKIKYTSKADGNKVISVLNQSYGMGTVGDAVAIFSGALGGIPGAIVGAFVGGGFKGFRSRCKEGIAEIKAHPSKGAIYMYLDRVDWKAS